MSRVEKRKSQGKRAKHENVVTNKKKNESVENKKQPKVKNKKKKGKALKIILIILIVLLVIVSTIFGTYVYKSGGDIKSAVLNMVKDVVGNQDPIFVLVLGVSEDISVELTDTIMLAGYNPDTNQAFLLSIPRDTFVGKNESTAGGYDKINALYQTDPQKTVTAVQNLTGIKIDYYITVKTSVLVDIVDSIGGVKFNVPIDMDYDDPTQDLHIHLDAGEQVLNGEQAEWLVRFRHNNNGTTYSAEYGDNDEGRMRTQREFLKELAKQVIQTKNVDQIKQVATAIFDNLETNITLNKMLGYAPYIIEFNVDNLQMEQLPGVPAKINNLWFYKANSSEIEELIDGYMEKLGLSEAEKKQHTVTKTTPNKTTTTTKNQNTNKTKNENTITNNIKNEVTNTVNKNNTISNTANTVKPNNKNEITNSTNKNNTVVDDDIEDDDTASKDNNSNVDDKENTEDTEDTEDTENKDDLEDNKNTEDDNKNNNNTGTSEENDNANTEGTISKEDNSESEPENENDTVTKVE